MIEKTVEQFEKDPSGVLAAAKNEGVLVTQDGKPMAVVVGLNELDEEDMEYVNSPEFWKMIEESRRSPAIPWEEAKKELFRDEAV